MMVPLWMYLIVAAGMFCIGVYGVLSRRNAVAILMSVELMLNAIIINLVAFWRYVTPTNMSGQAFAAFVFVVAAAEAAIGLAIVIAIYRNRRSTVVEDVNLLKG
ncbi:MAG: NADH-quinone oxidoreductase subunit NuoK [Phototrophicales bacterium]|nr:MAG: NADH-quinone oxidoreductase subunit NuoK [Phototrophicales bacterium]